MTSIRRTSFRLLCTLAVAGLLSLSGRAQVAPAAGTAGAEAAHDDALRVLFIGNSYTYVNNLPEMVTELAASAYESRPMEAGMVAIGGATLQQHWEGGQALIAIRQGRWDYVVLQEQSALGATALVNGRIPINAPTAFHKYARLFDAEIRKAGAKTVFYLTWARRNQPDTQGALTEAYVSIAKELHALVAPVGLAWESALKQNLSLTLHQDDSSHPTAAGSYLTACVFYGVFYEKSPVGLPNRILGRALDMTGRTVGAQGQGSRAELANLSKPDAAFLQRVAWQTVQQQRRLGADSAGIWLTTLVRLAPWPVQAQY